MSLAAERSHSARELALTPQGHVICRLAAGDVNGAAQESADFEGIHAAFAVSQAEGLFALAVQSRGTLAAGASAFWGDFARRYLSELCLVPETAGSRIATIDPPAADVLAGFLETAPPAPGAEYLTVDVLMAIWRDLDTWIRSRVECHKGGIAGFLKERAPLWHQVGRICFHLAENNRDPDFPFAFLATYAAEVSRQSRVRYQPLGKALEEYAGARNKDALVRLLAPIQRASENSNIIRELVESGDIYHPLAWSQREAYRFLQEMPLYEECGVLVRVPDWWRKRPRPQAGIVIGQKRQATLGASAMLDFKLTLALGEETLTDEEWQALLDADEGLVWLKGRWVEVDHEKLDRALAHWKDVERASRDGLLSFHEGMRLLAGAPADLAGDEGLSQDEREWSFVSSGDWLSQLLAERRTGPHSATTRLAGALRTSLRPYQVIGVDWLHDMSRIGLGACLADDMGLGKTVQILALLLLIKRKQRGKSDTVSLLVLPTSLLANWKSEISRFAPSLRAVFLHASEMGKESLDEFAAAPADSLSNVDVVLTTYGMLQRLPWLRAIAWRLVVLDEAQAIKNPASQQTRAVKKLKCDARVALTGTPVENRLSDLWSLFDFLCPGLLGSAGRFKKFVKGLEQRQQDRYGPLRNLVRPYILRRLKTDKSIIDDLPDKSEVKAFCNLSKRQAALYRKTVSEMATAMEGQEGIKRRGLVLAYLMRFKQICNHPSHLLGDGKYQPRESGKFARLAEICEEIASRQQKALVFTQFREMTEPLAAFLADVFARPGVVLDGKTPLRVRKSRIDQFQRDDGPPYFVLSLKAGGTGLNLTAASHVIHFDRWWNPAVEQQATDRAFRIGQHRSVLVQKFVCRGTIEERIDELIEEKQSLSAELLETGPDQLLTEMNDAQLLELVALDVNKAMA